jgi:hypothetical protein
VEISVRTSQFGLCVFGAALLLLADSLSAATVSVNFHVSNDADAQADHELTGSESAGVGTYASTNWNNIAVGNGGLSSGTIFSPTVLADDSGNVTTISIAPSADSFHFVGYCAGPAADVSDADSVLINQGVGDVTSFTTNGVGQVKVYPADMTTYTLRASNTTSGVVQDSVTVTNVSAMRFRMKPVRRWRMWVREPVSSGLSFCRRQKAVLEKCPFSFFQWLEWPGRFFAMFEGAFGGPEAYV